MASATHDTPVISYQDHLIREIEVATTKDAMEDTVGCLSSSSSLCWYDTLSVTSHLELSIVVYSSTAAPSATVLQHLQQRYFQSTTHGATIPLILVMPQTVLPFFGLSVNHLWA
ncbi:hypothetical protein Nepgr_001194 [Nepenthes gracilis]|uniref:Uncharacterized protein n=1 Tax=Nepenthes gracilis TaxID=150966 RepID=A0AAD3P2F2_NEPGR|nr:hypothetical protein Nepgr_001194 [Nepenthes gracilis]